MIVITDPHIQCPPDTCHPAYAGREDLRDWLLHGPYRDIKIPAARSLRAFDDDPLEPVTESIIIRTMTRRKAWGYAPYVGRPFVYVWPVGVDDLGRHISGPSAIVYTEPLW